jgi:hypothetical protein
MVGKIHLCGGTAAFRSFLRELTGDRLTRFDLADGLPPYRPGESVLYVILPEYERGETGVRALPMEELMVLGEYKRNGARIYVENYPSRDYLSLGVFGFFMTGRSRYFYEENVAADETLLQAAGAFYFPQSQPYTREVQVLARISDGAGLHRETALPQFQCPVVTDDSSGCIAATMNLTCFDPLFMRPRREWKKFFLGLWCRLLDIDPDDAEKTFEKIWPPVIETAGRRDLRKALLAAINWHLASGLLPAADGSRGAYEMIRSDDLEFRANLRTDSILVTGALLTGAGRVFEREEWLRTGATLADFILDRKIQTEDGFIRWYDNQPRVFSNDLGRHGLALLSLWENTGAEHYRECASRLAQAALKWLARDGVCCGTFDTRKGFSGASGVPSPVFHGELAAFLLKLDTPECREAVRKILDSIDLESRAIGHSLPDVWSRALLMYSCAHQKIRDCSAELGRLLDYYEAHQEPCGGIREDDLFARRSAPQEAGVAQGGGVDRIADQLYCTDYVFAALSVLRGKTDDPRVEKMYRALKSFLLDIQIVSRDKRFDGAWMRAFDMEYGEYYGLTLDRDWGPYCIMAGWTMGIIPLVLLEELGANTFFC